MQNLELDDLLLRVREIVSNPHAKPPHAGLLPIGRTKFLKLVKAGVLPQPIRIGARGVYWKKSDIDRVRSSGAAG
jgi:predicted DNA-binding transcriptional regulator AlpA